MSIQEQNEEKRIKCYYDDNYALYKDRMQVFCSIKCMNRYIKEINDMNRERNNFLDEICTNCNKTRKVHFKQEINEYYTAYYCPASEFKKEKK